MGKNEDSLAMKTAVSAGWLIATRMLGRILGLCNTLVLARILVPGDFGLVAMATTFSQAVEAFAQVGIQDALIRAENHPRELYNTAFSMQIVRNLLVGAAIAAGAYPASIYFEEPRLMNLILILAVSASLYFENVGIIEYRREMRFFTQFMILTIPRVLSLVVTLSIAIVYRSYWALLAGIIANQFCYVVLTYVVHPFRPKLSFAKWRDLLGFSVWTWFSSLARMVLQRADPFLIGPRAGSGALATFLVSSEIALLPVTELVAPLAAAMFPGMAMAQRQGKNSAGITLDTIVNIFPVLMGLGIAISGASGYIVAVALGEKWVTAGPLMAVIAIGCLFFPANRICSATLVARGEVRKDFTVIALAAGARVAAIGAAVHLSGDLSVVAWACVASSAAEAFLSLLFLHSLGGTEFRKALAPVGRTVVAGILTAGLLFFSGFGWQPVIGVPVLSAFFLGAALVIGTLVVYAVISLGLWALNGLPAGPEAQIVRLSQRFGRHIASKMF